MNEEKFNKIEEDVFKGIVSTKEHQELEWLISGMKDHYSEQYLKSLIHEVHLEKQSSTQQDNPSPSQHTRIFTLKKIVSIAAIFMVFLIPWFLIQNDQSTEVLYTSYYNTPPNLMTTRSSDAQDPIQLAGQAYSNRDFNQVLTILDGQSGEMALFYTSTALMELERFDNAKKSWESYLLQHTLMQRIAQFNLSLCYLKLENHQKATDILHLLSSGNDDIANKSRQLLEKLNE